METWFRDLQIIRKMIILNRLIRAMRESCRPENIQTSFPGKTVQRRGIRLIFNNEKTRKVPKIFIMKSFKLNLIPGDGIGVDVIREGRRVLDSIAAISGGISFQYNELPWSCEYYLKNGKMMPDDGMTILRDCDAILLGAVGFPGVPDHISLRQLLLPIRVEFDEYVNMRPVKMLPGLNSPLKNTAMDFVCIRENSEGEYCGQGEWKNAGRPDET